MSLTTSLLLGILQGMTEFLPVSSSGHLVIAQSLIPDFEQSGVLFDVVLHAGTLFSILFFFRKKIIRLDTYYLKLLFIGTVPAVLIGLLFKDLLEGLFSNMRVVGIALIITGIMNYLTDKMSAKKESLSIIDSLFIGFFQAIAIIPGISRSGSTIFAGVKREISKSKSAEYSFLLSIPAVFGANVLQFFSYHGESSISYLNYILGFTTAFVSGYFAISVVYKFLLSKRFRVFAYYATVLGTLVVLLG